MRKRRSKGVLLPRWSIVLEVAGIILLIASYGQIKGYWFLPGISDSSLVLKIILLAGIALLLPAALMVIIRGINAFNPQVLGHEKEPRASDNKDRQS